MDYPILVLDLHQACNQQCAYCVADSGPLKSFGRCPEIKKIKPFLRAGKPWHFVITGGEPTITPNWEEVVNTLLPYGKISIQTNLKAGISRIINPISTRKCGYILATLHSVMLKREDQFMNGMKMMRLLGYPVVAKLVLDDGMLPEFARICDRFREYGIPYILSPEVVFPEAVARKYPYKVWEKIVPYITLDASRQYFMNGIPSRDKECYAGSRLFYARLDTGVVTGCCHGYPPKLGNLWKGRFSPEKEAIKCKLDRCMCDFHWYMGIVDGTTSDEWEALINGKG